MNYKTFLLKDNHHCGNGFLYLNFYIFNEEKYFSILHSNSNVQFFFSFKEENIAEEHFENLSDIFYTYINTFTNLSLKLLKLDKLFKNRNLNFSNLNLSEFELLFKHSLYSNNLYNYLDLYKVDEQHISKLFYLLCEHKYAFQYIFIYYFCQEYFFNIFEPNNEAKENLSFFDFIFDKLNNNPVKELIYLVSDSSIVYFQFFHSIYSQKLNFEDIVKNMLSQNIDLTEVHKEFFYIYLPTNFYPIALSSISLDNLQKFTFDHNIILDEYNTPYLDSFLTSLSQIKIGDYLFKHNKTIQGYLSFLNNSFEIIQDAYDEEYCIDNIMLFQPFFQSVIETLDKNNIQQLKFNKSKLLSLLREQYLLKLELDKF